MANIDWCVNTKLNKSIKKDIKDWAEANLANYIPAESLKFEHSKLNGNRSMYFVPRGGFLRVTQYYNGTIAADYNDMISMALDDKDCFPDMGLLEHDK